MHDKSMKFLLDMMSLVKAAKIYSSKPEGGVLVSPKEKMLN